MRSKAPTATASTKWVIGAAFLLSVVSIAVVTTLQRRANSSRDAQVELLKIAREFDAFQSYPFDANGQGGAAQADVRRHMRASERDMENGLTRLLGEHPSSHLSDAIAPYRANVATTNQIERYVARNNSAGSDKLGFIAGRQQRLVARELGEAGADYQRLASRSLTLATVGGAGMIMALVSLFAFFFIRSQKAHATAQRLARQNAQMLLDDSQLQVIQRLALAAEYRDDETGQHTRRVGELSTLIGEALGMPEDELVLLQQAAPLHDVGKIAIPDSILLKPGPLAPVEFEQMRAHTTRGAAMLAGPGFPLLEMAEQVAMSHHERWDGTGYPSGLSGAAIPRVGRIVAIADVFDALTHARPYKEAWTVDAAVTEITRQSGRQFDPGIVDAFLRVLPDHLRDTAAEGARVAAAASPPRRAPSRNPLPLPEEAVPGRTVFAMRSFGGDGEGGDSASS